MKLRYRVKFFDSDSLFGAIKWCFQLHVPFWCFLIRPYISDDSWWDDIFVN